MEAVLEIIPVLAHHEKEFGEIGAVFQLQHAQAVRASWECLELLFLGYGHGALAHARTVLELSVAVQALAKITEENPQFGAAPQFFDHEELVRAKQAIEHDTFADLLGEDRHLPENQRAAREVIDGYRTRLGTEELRAFQQDWGWLGGAFGVSRPGFREVSRYVGLEGRYNYYRFASNVTHGGTRGPILNRVDVRGSRVPSYGPMNLFLVDPAQVTLLRLAALAGTVVSFAIQAADRGTEEHDEDLAQRRLSMMRSLAMLDYAERINRKAVDEYLRVSRHIEQMESMIHASRLRRGAVRMRYRLRSAVRILFTSSSRP